MRQIPGGWMDAWACYTALAERELFETIKMENMLMREKIWPENESGCGNGGDSNKRYCRVNVIKWWRKIIYRFYLAKRERWRDGPMRQNVHDLRTWLKNIENTKGCGLKEEISTPGHEFQSNGNWYSEWERVHFSRMPGQAVIRPERWELLKFIQFSLTCWEKLPESENCAMELEQRIYICNEWSQIN